jgi:hypothetical protein
MNSCNNIWMRIKTTIWPIREVGVWNYQRTCLGTARELQIKHHKAFNLHKITTTHMLHKGFSKQICKGCKLKMAFYSSRISSLKLCRIKPWTIIILKILNNSCNIDHRKSKGLCYLTITSLLILIRLGRRRSGNSKYTISTCKNTHSPWVYRRSWTKLNRNKILSKGSRSSQTKTNKSSWKGKCSQICTINSLKRCRAKIRRRWQSNLRENTWESISEVCLRRLQSRTKCLNDLNSISRRSTGRHSHNRWRWIDESKRLEAKLAESSALDHAMTTDITTL